MREIMTGVRNDMRKLAQNRIVYVCPIIILAMSATYFLGYNKIIAPMVACGK